MKRFNVSEHIYYLFKSNNNKGEHNSSEDVFVPKIFMNLYNLSKKDKKPNNTKYNKKKLHLLNNNSNISKRKIEKLNISGLNNNLKEFIIFGNKKRYYSFEPNNMKTFFPSIIKSNNKDTNINDKLKIGKFEGTKNKILKIKNSEYSEINHKLSDINKIIEIKNYKHSKYNELEKSKEDKSKNIMNFSYEYNNKENYQNETSELESLSLRNKNE